MGLPNAPTAYTDVCRRWRVPVRHSGRFSGVSAAADLDRAAKECRNPLGADATKSARPSSIIQIDRNLLETKLDRLVAEKVTEPLNASPALQADEIANAARYERAGERKAYRAGHYDRSLTAKAGRLGLKVPKLKGEVFESAVIERHRRREESVDPPLSRQVPAR